MPLVPVEVVVLVFHKSPDGEGVRRVPEHQGLEAQVVLADVAWDNAPHSDEAVGRGQSLRVDAKLGLAECGLRIYTSEKALPKGTDDFTNDG